MSAAQQQFDDRNYSLPPYTFTLTAGQVVNDILIQTDRDADFFWTVTEAVTTYLPFGFRFQDSSLNYLSDGYVGSFVFGSQFGVGQPYITEPAIYCPAGSSIRLNLIELSGGSNGPNTLIIRGFKRFTH